MTADTETSLSAECAVARKYNEPELHGLCRRTDNIPLPHSKGKILLVERCRCACHSRRQAAPASQ